MQTEFKKLTFDQLRYSIVWEDHQTLSEGLEIDEQDAVAVITSAGDNVLNALLKSPKKVVAIDLNPHQNALLDFKRYLIKNHEYEVNIGLLGLKGSNEVTRAYQLVSSKLCKDSKRYWDLFFETHPEGIMQSGKLETYLTSFVQQLSPDALQLLKAVSVASNIEDQKRRFQELVHKSDFEASFITYVGKKNLGKARDPRLFKFVGEGVGETFYQCLKNQSETVLWRDNFHWQFFFFGSENMSTNILPPCYREENFARLKAKIDRLEIREGEIANYLLSDEGQNITKASLSNVFEYASQEEFQSVIHRLAQLKRTSKLSIIYWNLLQHQVASCDKGTFTSCLLPEQKTSCFYFKNAYGIQFQHLTSK